MKPMFRVVALILLAALIFAPLQTAKAKGLLDGQVIFGQSFTLKSGQTLEGDLVVFGGSAVIEEGATVNGSVILFGGTLDIQGEVTADAAIVGGSIMLGPRSHIHGNLATVGATISRAEGAQVDGQITNAATSLERNGENGAAPTPPSAEMPGISVAFQPLAAVLNALWQAIGWGALAMLVMIFLAAQTGRVAEAFVNQPLTAGGLGLLTLIAAPLVIIILLVTILLIPVALVALLVLGIAVAFGWIVVGYEVGARFTKAIHQDWHPALTGGLGTFALSFLSAALTGIPGVSCIGWVVPFLLGTAGLGAVIMTRFGTQSLPAPAAKAEAAPPDAVG